MLGREEVVPGWFLRTDKQVSITWCGAESSAQKQLSYCLRLPGILKNCFLCNLQISRTSENLWHHSVPVSHFWHKCSLKISGHHAHTPVLVCSPLDRLEVEKGLQEWKGLLKGQVGVSRDMGASRCSQ